MPVANIIEVEEVRFDRLAAWDLEDDIGDAFRPSALVLWQAFTEQEAYEYPLVTRPDDDVPETHILQNFFGSISQNLTSLSIIHSFILPEHLELIFEITGPKLVSLSLSINSYGITFIKDFDPTSLQLCTKLQKLSIHTHDLSGIFSCLPATLQVLKWIFESRSYSNTRFCQLLKCIKEVTTLPCRRFYVVDNIVHFLNSIVLHECEDLRAFFTNDSKAAIECDTAFKKMGVIVCPRSMEQICADNMSKAMERGAL